MKLNNKFARNVLRVMSGVVLGFYMVFRIIIPLVDKEPLYLDKNDGYVLIGCIVIWLAVEVVRGIAVYWMNKKVGRTVGGQQGEDGPNKTVGGQQGQDDPDA